MVWAMLAAVPRLLNVLCVVLLVTFMFAVLGINLVGGLFWGCKVSRVGTGWSGGAR